MSEICETCGRPFGTKKALKRHEKRQHNAKLSEWSE